LFFRFFPRLPGRVINVLALLDEQYDGLCSRLKSHQHLFLDVVDETSYLGNVAYQFRVVLQETDPPIWRRFVVPSGITLHRLHIILQEVMGWTNSHLYRFKIGTKEYAEPDPENEFNELYFKNSRRTKLERLVINKGNTFLYEYDFGDSWIHELVVEDILEPGSSQQYPVCLAGERACPPEDCVGPHGYAELLGIISNPEHEEYLDKMAWHNGGRFHRNTHTDVFYSIIDFI